MEMSIVHVGGGAASKVATVALAVAPQAAFHAYAHPSFTLIQSQNLVKQINQLKDSRAFPPSSFPIANVEVNTDAWNADAYNQGATFVTRKGDANVVAHKPGDALQSLQAFIASDKPAHKVYASGGALSETFLKKADDILRRASKLDVRAIFIVHADSEENAEFLVQGAMKTNVEGSGKCIVVYNAQAMKFFIKCDKAEMDISHIKEITDMLNGPKQYPYVWGAVQVMATATFLHQLKFFMTYLEQLPNILRPRPV